MELRVYLEASLLQTISLYEPELCVWPLVVYKYTEHE